MKGKIINFYKKTFGLLWRLQPPFLVYSQCRFVPTCSEYFVDSVFKYGIMRGGIKGVWRILRCNPFTRVRIDQA